MLVKAILLVPSPEHREALLGDEACDQSPPIVFRCVDGMWRADDDLRTVWTGRAGDTALPLVWNGKAIRSGLARAAEAFAFAEGFRPRGVVGWHGSRCYAPWKLHITDDPTPASFILQISEDARLICVAHQCKGVGRLDSDTFGVPALAEMPPDIGDLREAWALGVSLEAGGYGRMEVLS